MLGIDGIAITSVRAVDNLSPSNYKTRRNGMILSLLDHMKNEPSATEKYC